MENSLPRKLGEDEATSANLGEEFEGYTFYQRQYIMSEAIRAEIGVFSGVL